LLAGQPKINKPVAETKIKSEGLETSRKTGESFFDTKKDITTNIEAEDESADKGTEEKIEKNQTPAEISRKKYYDSEKTKNDAKAKLFDAIKYAIYILLGLGAIFVIIWAYKVNNIAEPIGGMKVEIQYLKDNLKDIKDQMQKLQDKVDVIEKNYKIAR